MVTIICMCASRILVTLAFNINYFNWHICYFTNVLVLLEVYISFAGVGDGDIKRLVLVSVHGTISRHKSMILATFPERTTSFSPSAFVKLSLVSHTLLAALLNGQLIYSWGRPEGALRTVPYILQLPGGNPTCPFRLLSRPRVPSR